FPEEVVEKSYQYDEIAYQKNCGDTSAYNLANNLTWGENPDSDDYQKSYEICLSAIEKIADDQCISLIAFYMQEGYLADPDYFNAYVLYKWRSENMHETLSADFEWLDARISEVEKEISDEDKIVAQEIVDVINKDFDEIYKYLYLSNRAKYNDTLEVQQSDDNNSSNDLIPSYQKEIILSRSSSEVEISGTVKDTSPPAININENIKVQGFVANLEIMIEDESKIEAVFIDDTPVVIDYNNLGNLLINQSIFIGDKDKDIVITAYDKWGLSGVKTVSLKKSIESFNINYGKYYALIIGNNDYEYLPKLKTAVNDAETMSQILEDKYNFEKIITLTNASRKEILTELYSLKKTLSFNDNLLIYYAGHGQIDRQLDIGYWQPVDALPDLPTEWIGIDTITSIISTMKSKHILVVADSCYSGLLTRSSTSIENNSFSTRELYLQRMNDKKSRIAFTSGGEEPVPDGGGGNHSIFAKLLIDFLKENNREITISEISSRITQQVITNSDQTPELAPMHKSGHDGGEFIFVPSI
ncbi:caspase family protein, partial [Alphaproteobacteria bacterium]|nr:caspase family protein [Alphaproteobacteria bacterium]